MKIVCLVSNPCVNDSRVIRQAEALAAAGHEVTVLARSGQGAPCRERVNGVAYRRAAGLFDRSVPEARRRMRLAAHGRRTWPKGAWRGRLWVALVLAVWPRRGFAAPGQWGLSGHPPGAPSRQPAPGGDGSPGPSAT